MSVYLIHFEEKLHHAQHYIGWTKYTDPWRRIQHHFSGQGARLTKAAKAAGIKKRLVRVWINGDRQLERDLKKKHSGKVLCPICNKKMRKYLIRREIIS